MKPPRGYEAIAEDYGALHSDHLLLVRANIHRELVDLALKYNIVIELLAERKKLIKGGQ